MTKRRGAIIAWAVVCGLSLGCGPTKAGSDVIPDGGRDSSHFGPPPDGGDDAPPCVPQSCDDLGVDCGQQNDGCGDIIDCGTCTGAGEYCGGGGPSLCGVGPCTPQTCDDLGANCGLQSNGCGTLIDCGTCTSPAVCGGAGVPNQCGVVPCTPLTCQHMGFDCGPVANGCGGLAQCGSCSVSGEFCGGGGPNKCGNPAPACTPKSCTAQGANCGQVSDGCGGLTASCGSCTGQDCCGCGGTPSVCGGAPAACVAKSCAQLGANCGYASDGCGGVTALCGSCTGTDCCGCGGTPNVCGGPPACTALTCASFPSGTCGRQSDGCGGLTLDCGGCPSGEFCGGGGPNLCGAGNTCVNLQCLQVTCSGGATTSISGTVHDPAGLRPLPNVYVYVPNGTPATFIDGASCGSCDTALTGLPLVTTLTDATGHFKLDNMPVGANIPVVIQLGKWRRQIRVTTARCADTFVLNDLTRLPRTKAEGNIPKIAISTGGFDSIECLLRKIGIADSEFTNPSGTGRVNLYVGQPQGLTGSNAQYNAALKYDNSLGGVAFPDATTLWDDLPSLQAYDVVILSCEGNTFPTTKPDSSLKAMYDYLNAGGRVFASHYHHYWVSANTNGSGNGAWSTLASWIYPSPAMLTTGLSFTIPEDIVMSFPKGDLMAHWLLNVGASTALGDLNIYDTKNSVQSFDSTRVLEWIYATNVLRCTDGTCGTRIPVAHASQYITFNTPVGQAADNQCGRFIFSDIHVSSGDRGTTFPKECASTGMSPQELALEFMFFDLASAVCDEQQPPPSCTPLTCLDQGIECGPAPDGCGGVITNCGTCPSGKVCSTGGKCATSSCTPTTCQALGHNCGSWADGCGNILACGTCPSGQSCGGAGTPGQCGAGSCTPATCVTLGHNCGSWADGCGNTLGCGTCTTPETCGGGGVPGQCGGNGCQTKTCAELGVLCGLSGDGCGGTIDCGPCQVCTPLPCGGRCGPQGDGCGNVIICPDCPPGTCVPTTCEQASAQCGGFPDGCGNLLDCGPCTSGSCLNNVCIDIG
jgi:hypothetical protein